MKTYEATVTREDGYWVAVIPGLRGGATEARTIANLKVEVRDLVAGLLELDDDAFEVELKFGEDFDSAVGQLVDAQERLAKAREEYEVAQRDAVRALAEKNISTRDSAQLIGVSHQRVSQLLNA